MCSRSKAFFKEATKRLEYAKEELLKPAEDLVSFSVCKNSQFAIENFLKGFLLRNNVEIDGNDTIAVLYKKCAEIDENFKDIYMGAVGCINHAINSHYCLGIDSVNACFDTAESIEAYLKKNNVS